MFTGSSDQIDVHFAYFHEEESWRAIYSNKHPTLNWYPRVISIIILYFCYIFQYFSNFLNGPELIHIIIILSTKCFLRGTVVEKNIGTLTT